MLKIIAPGLTAITCVPHAGLKQLRVKERVTEMEQGTLSGKYFNEC